MYVILAGQDLDFSDPQTSQRLKKYVDQTEAVVLFSSTLEFWKSIILAFILSLDDQGLFLYYNKMLH